MALIWKRNGTSSVVVGKQNGHALIGGEKASSPNLYDWLAGTIDTTLTGSQSSASNQYACRVSQLNKGAISWGDGNYDEAINPLGLTTLNVQHTYSASGVYPVRYLVTSTATPGFQYQFSQAGFVDYWKWTNVTRWGENLQQYNITGYFANASQLVTFSATDIPNCTSWVDAFQGSAINEPKMVNWDMQFTGFRDMFDGCPNFNQPIGVWDMTNNAGSLARLFSGCASFNQDLSNWGNTLPAANRDMEQTFASMSVFNSSVANWDTSLTENFDRCFVSSPAFNQDLTTWDVSAATNFSSMFRSATAFNNGGNTATTGFGSWDVNNVLNFSSMFRSCPNFACDISTWSINTNPANNVEMQLMFLGCSSLDFNAGNWNVSRVSNMALMFQGCSSFNNGGVGGTGVGLDSWTMTNVTSTSDMFKQATSFNQELGNWSFRPAGVGMHGMFASATAFVGTGLGNWDVSMVTDFSEFAYGATSINFPITHPNYWELSPGVNFERMFSDCTNLNGGQAAGVGGRNFEMKFSTTPGDTYDLGNFFQGSDRFNQDISTDSVNGYWEMDNVTSLASFLYQALDFNQDVSNWNVGNCTDFSFCFGSTSFNFSLSSWNVSNATSMASMFYNGSINQPLAWGTKTSLVENMSQMFFSTPFDQDISGWSIASLTDASNMFQNNTAWSTTNYDLLLDSTTGWASQATIQSGVSFSAFNTTYTLGGNAEAGHNYLTGTKMWNIVDGNP